ncbi:DUF1097 domain-containing protein [Clostridium sp. DL1XJH146]
MSFKKFIWIPVIVALLAFTIQIVDQLLCPLVPPANNVGFGWIAFQSWAVYFLAGCNVKGGVKALIGYVNGIIASILIMEIGAALSASLGFFAFPLAVFIVVVPVISLERVPWADFVPSVFIGSGVFFGFMSYVPGATYTAAITTELIYCAIGLFYGYVTITLRGMYEASVKKNEPAVTDSVQSNI